MVFPFSPCALATAMNCRLLSLCTSRWVTTCETRIASALLSSALRISSSFGTWLPRVYASKQGDHSRGDAVLDQLVQIVEPQLPEDDLRDVDVRVVQRDVGPAVDHEEGVVV